MHRSTSLSFLRRAGVVAAVAALGVAAFMPSQATASQALAQPAKKAAISTYKSWDGVQQVVSFGCPNTTTYGQVITIPANKSHLTKFTFPWINSSTGSMVVRGEAYAWDGSKATGSAIFESKPRTINYSDGVFHNVSFKVSSAAVTAGSQYVVFASIDKDFAQCTNNYTLGWGAVSDSAYAGGTFVYQNNGGDASQWTATPWNTFGIDLAFKVYLTK